MVKLCVVRFHQDPIAARGGVSATVVVTESIGSVVLSSGITAFAPGASIRVHSHNTEEMITVLEGRALFDVEGERAELGPYDTCFVPAGTFHTVTNSGETVMRILWVYGSTRPVRIFAEAVHNPEQPSRPRWTASGASKARPGQGTGSLTSQKPAPERA